jgi:acetyl-CoA synthetase
MTVEGIVAMQACARIGAPTPSFSAASPPSRCATASTTPALSADHLRRPVPWRQGHPAQAIADEAFHGWLRLIKSVIVFKRTGGESTWLPVATVAARRPGQPADVCEPEWVEAEHPLFLLYTSGSTGKPKGVQHSTGGYLLHAIMTMKWTFDIKPTSSGVRPTSAGSPATPTSPTARWPAVRPRSSSKACRPIRMPAVSGR